VNYIPRTIQYIRPFYYKKIKNKIKRLNPKMFEVVDNKRNGVGDLNVGRSAHLPTLETQLFE
jgi:hypothetical protein